MQQPCERYKFRKIMVIDDAHIDRFLVEKLARKVCFAEEVVSCESGEAALKYFSDNATDTGDLPQLIFLDINMPGMSGFEFLDEYMKFPELLRLAGKIVMLTSSLHPDDKIKAAANPHIIRFVNKPINGELLKTLSGEI